MLKGIDPLLNAEVLGALRAMGHGDDLIVADMNFPAESVARQTVLGRLLRIDAPSARVARAVLSVYPLDGFVDDGAARMEVIGEPSRVEPVAAEVQAEIDAAEGRPWPMIGIERYRLLRAGEGRLCGDPDRGAAVLRLLRTAQGRDPAGRVTATTGGLRCRARIPS